MFRTDLIQSIAGPVCIVALCGTEQAGCGPPLLAHCREEEATEVHGHITSLAVARTHRKLGLASRLMSAARECSGALPGRQGLLAGCKH